MTDLDIAQRVEMQHINSVAAKLGIDQDDLEQYGKHKAKLPLHLIDEDKIAEGIKLNFEKHNNTLYKCFYIILALIPL